MIQVVQQIGGEELAKVLMFYGLIESTIRAEQKVMCPFHEDRNPSMKVDLIKGSYFCFGCEERGNALQFVQRANPKLNDLQSCILFSEILNSKEVKRLKIKAKARVKKGRKQSLIEAYDYYYGLSTIDWNINSNIPYNEVTKVEVDRCREYMVNRGFNTKILNISGAKVTYNQYYPIIFPIMDNGEFKGWVTRTTNKRVESRRKYLYNEGLDKLNTLAGEYNNTKGTIVVCEGYMDMLKLKMLGYNKVVALLGWHISNEQVEKLKSEGITHVISALDNDKCGNKGTEYLKEFFRVTRFQYIDGIKDPGDLDKETFRIIDRKTKEIVRKNKYGRNKSGEK